MPISRISTLKSIGVSQISLINYTSHHFISKYDWDYHKMRQAFYCRIWQFLQNVTFTTKCVGNYLKHIILHSSLHRFTDDTNILFLNRSLKLINKLVNYDTCKLSLNVVKIKITICKNKLQQIKNNSNPIS